MKLTNETVRLDVKYTYARGSVEFVLALDGKGTTATLNLPRPMTRREMRAVRAFVDLLDGVVQDEEAPDAR